MSYFLKGWTNGVFTTCVVSLLSKPHTFGRKSGKLPNIRPKPNIRWFLAAEYSVSAEIQNSCFGRTLQPMLGPTARRQSFTGLPNGSTLLEKLFWVFWSAPVICTPDCQSHHIFCRSRLDRKSWCRLHQFILQVNSCE
jgi:hypothetical protein